MAAELALNAGNRMYTARFTFSYFPDRQGVIGISCANHGVVIKKIKKNPVCFVKNCKML